MEAAFDTLAVAEDLEAHGFERDQAKALANAIRSVQGGLATKADLEGVKGAIKGEIARLETRLVDKLASQQRWYVGLLFAAAVLAVAAVKLI